MSDGRTVIQLRENLSNVLTCSPSKRQDNLCSMWREYRTAVRSHYSTPMLTGPPQHTLATLPRSGEGDEIFGGRVSSVVAPASEVFDSRLYLLDSRHGNASEAPLAHTTLVDAPSDHTTSRLQLARQSAFESCPEAARIYDRLAAASSSPEMTQQSSSSSKRRVSPPRGLREESAGLRPQEALGDMRQSRHQAIRSPLSEGSWDQRRGGQSKDKDVVGHQSYKQALARQTMDSLVPLKTIVQLQDLLLDTSDEQLQALSPAYRQQLQKLASVIQHRCGGC